MVIAGLFIVKAEQIKPVKESVNWQKGISIYLIIILLQLEVSNVLISISQIKLQSKLLKNQELKLQNNNQKNRSKIINFVNAACEPKTASNGGIADVPQAFQSGQGTVDVTPNGYTDFVTGDCSNYWCSLRSEADCYGFTTYQLPRTGTNFLYSDNSSPYKVTINTDTMESEVYNNVYEYCFRCRQDGSNSVYLYKQQILIYSAANVNSWCSSTATYSSKNHNPSSTTYSSGNTQTFGTIQDFFELYESYCGAFSGTCTLYESDCTTSFADSTNVYLDSSFSLIGRRDVAAGYSYTVCIKCVSGSKTVQDNSINVEQKNMCDNVLDYYKWDQDVTEGYHKTQTAKSIKIRSDFTDWDTHFNNQNPSQCQIQSCTLYDNDCSSSFSGSSVIQMASSSPWGITMDLTQTSDYEYYTCVKCIALYGQEITDRYWKIKFEYCKTLSDKSSSTDVNLAFTPGAVAGETVVPSSSFNTWDNFFDNSDDTNCPITNCELVDKRGGGGCQSTFSGSADVTMSSSSPWTITASKTNTAGYSYDVCVKCTNGGEEVQLTGWTIAQTGLTCSASDVSTGTRVSLSFTAADSSESVVPTSPFSTWEAYFEEIDTTNCGFTECILRNKNDCDGSTFTGSSDIQIQALSPWGITAVKNNPAGYNYDVCVRCTNTLGNQIYLQDWQILQDGHCVDKLTSATPTTVTNYYIPMVSSQTTTVTPVASGFLSWDSYFQNTDTTNCAISSCVLSDSGSCGGTYSHSSDITMTSSSPWTISASVTNSAGYSHSVCVRCYVASTSYRYIDLDNWIISQNAFSCTSTLTSTSGTNRLLAYDWSIASQTLTPSDTFSTWDALFSNTDTINCPITSCNIYFQGCSTPFSGGVLSMGSSSPWTITAGLQSTAGYDYTICVKCSNGGGSGQVDNWNIKLTGKCEATLTAASATAVTLAYVPMSDPLTQTVVPVTGFSTWDVFFQNSDTTRCSITSCVLHNGGNCGGSYSHSSDITISSSSPWTISASVTNAASSGYSHTVCVTCYQPSQLIVLDGWTITQSPYSCLSTLTAPTATNVDLAYDASASPQAIAPSTSFTTWDAFFGNPDTVNCPIHTCTFSTEGNCGAGDFDGSTNVVYQTTSPWGVTGVLTNLAGYNYRICVQCKNGDSSNSNGVSSAQIDSWVISASGPLCSTETIQVLKSGDYLILSVPLNSGTNSKQTILFANFKDKFYPTIAECLIDNYRLVVKNKDNSYSAYQGSDIAFDSSFNIMVATSASITKTLYIEASNPTAIALGYLPFYITVTNFAPYFVDGSPMDQQIEYDYELPEESSLFTYTIPAFTDNEDSNVAISVSNLEEFMTYNEAEQTIQVKVSPEIVGNYTVNLDLSDSEGKVASYQVKFQVKVINEVVEEEEAAAPGFEMTLKPIEIDNQFLREEGSGIVVKAEEVKEENVIIEICKASVYEMTALGDLIVQFSTPMKTDYINLTWINSTIIDMYIIPADNRQSDEGFRLESINFTWNVTQYGKFDDQKGQMVFKLVFIEPLQISPLKIQDTLVINIKDKANFFISDSLNKDLDDKYTILQTKVQRQMEDNSLTQNFQSSSEQGSSGLKGMMIISFCINLILSGAMSYMVGWINSLQLIIHLPMLMTLIPANVASFFSLILPIVQFDLIPPEYSYELFLSFDDEPDEDFSEQFDTSVFDQMKDLGYDSHNSLRLLGSLFIVSMLYYVRLFFLFPVVLCISKLFKVGQGYSDELKKALIFNEIIVINLEAYLELLIAGYINYNFPLSSTDGEIVAQYVSYYAIFICLFLMPSISIWILIQNMDTIRSAEFHDNWGGYYEEINMKNKANICNYCIFMIRRLTFCLICFFLEDYAGIQLVCLNLLNLASMIYLGYFKPFDHRFKNRLEIFNEWQVMTCSFLMMTFTNLVGDIETQSYMGWYMIGSIVLGLLVNVTIIVFIGAKGVYLIGVKYYRRLKLKILGPEPKRLLVDASQHQTALREIQKLLRDRAYIQNKIDHLDRKKAMKEKLRKRKIQIEETIRKRLEEEAKEQNIIDQEEEAKMEAYKDAIRKKQIKMWNDQIEQRMNLSFSFGQEGDFNFLKNMHLGNRDTKDIVADSQKVIDQIDNLLQKPSDSNGSPKWRVPEKDLEQMIQEPKPLPQNIPSSDEIIKKIDTLVSKPDLFLAQLKANNLMMQEVNSQLQKKFKRSPKTYQEQEIKKPEIIKYSKQDFDFSQFIKK